MAEGQKRMARPNPILRANILMRITFWWLTKPFFRSIRRPLTDEAIYDVIPDASAQHRADVFERRWLAKKKSDRTKPRSLLKCLLISVWKDIVLGCTLTALTDVLKMCQPIILLVLLRYMQGSPSVTSSTAYILIATLAVTSVLSSFFSTHQFLKSEITAMNLRTSCGALILKKVMTLSSFSRRHLSTGHIMNLMSTDIETFHQALIAFNGTLSAVPLLVAYSVLIGHQVGVAVLPGLAAILLYLVLRMIGGTIQGKLRFRTAAWTDKRVLMMGEIIAAMRVVKMYCWETPFSVKAKELRRKEMKAHKENLLFVMLGMASGTAIRKVVLFVILVTYVTLGNAVHLEVAFLVIGWTGAVAYTLFRLLPFAFGAISEMMTAVRRLQDFLNAEDIESREQEPAIDKTGVKVSLTNVTASWETACEQQTATSDLETAHFQLEGVTLEAAADRLVVVVGPVGAGKSSLLMAILGELGLQRGQRSVNGTMAFVPQESWILSDTLQANVLMDKDMDKERYDQVLWACCLDEDLLQLPHGDMTLVGERGLSLSGGQKARVNLARAVYNDADIFLLDDPLSAVDSTVGNAIFQRCIGGLLKSKLCILVTHQLQYVQYADQVVIMNEGRISMVGSYKQITSNMPLELLDKDTKQVMTDNRSLPPKSDEGALDHVEDKTASDPPEVEKDATPEPVKEQQETGSVSLGTYGAYIKAGLGFIYIPLFLILQIILSGTDIASDWFSLQWPVDGATKTTLNGTTDTGAEVSGRHLYLVRYVSLVGAYILSTVIQKWVLAVFIVTASRRLYNNMFSRLMRTPIVFFERNPVGQVLNRCSRDTGFMDFFMPYPLHFGLECSFEALAYIIYCCVISPWMVAPVVILIIAFIAFCSSCIHYIRDIQRLEAALRSPTYSHLVATIQGAPVIRALRLQDRFLSEAYRVMDRHTSAWYIWLHAQRYVGLNLDLMTALLANVYLVVVVLLSGEGTDASAVALSGLYLLALVTKLQYAAQRIMEMETKMTSVERICQYSRLEQEAPEHTEVCPSPGWPQHGDIRFNNVCVTYKGSQNAAIGPLNVHFPAGKKTGIVGRTGAGKSSIFTGLLRMVEPTGTIDIDGIDVTKMGLTDLRKAISVIPQDPMLFSGTLRDNIDPFQEYTDEQIWTSLKQVQLDRKVKDEAGDLTTDVGEAGSNFSVGQRQLLCLARALLGNSRIIVIDEATANVDHRTDEIIQTTLRSQFSDCTLLVIAHRLNTIMSYDKIMVLDRGEPVEYDHPHALLQDSSGVFHQMVRQLGETGFQQMAAVAKETYHHKQLSLFQGISGKNGIVEPSDGQTITGSVDGETVVYINRTSL